MQGNVKPRFFRQCEHVTLPWDLSFCVLNRVTREWEPKGCYKESQLWPCRGNMLQGSVCALLFDYCAPTAFSFLIGKL
ncbi:MAG: hypothetical protein EBU90_25290 [Proteobacteria bacterium]|nr:hypothetical protein [Pseudomonadota bacterium]